MTMQRFLLKRKESEQAAHGSTIQAHAHLQAPVGKLEFSVR